MVKWLEIKSKIQHFPAQVAVASSIYGSSLKETYKSMLHQIEPVNKFSDPFPDVSKFLSKTPINVLKCLHIWVALLVQQNACAIGMTDRLAVQVLAWTMKYFICDLAEEEVRPFTLLGVKL